MATSNFGRLGCASFIESLMIGTRKVLSRNADLDVRNAKITGDLTVKGRLTYPENHIHGLAITIQTEAGGTTPRLTVGTGQCRNSQNTYNIIFTTPINIDLTLNGAGGLDVGSASADQWYAVHVIANRRTNAVSALLSLSVSSPTLPSGYDIFRRIGWARTTNFGTNDEIHFIPLIQKGNSNRRSYCYDWWQSNLRALFIFGWLWIQTGWLSVDLQPFMPPSSCSVDLKVKFDNVGVDAFEFPNSSAKMMIRVPGSITTENQVGEQPTGNEVLLGSPVVIWGQSPQGIHTEYITVCTDNTQTIEAVLMTPSGLSGMGADRPAEISVVGFHEDL